MNDLALWSPTPRSIAIFRALNLGDFLCAVPAFRALRHAVPTARITLIGLESMRPCIQRFGHYINELVDFPGDPAFPEQAARVCALPDFYRRMRALGFDLALQMHGSGVRSNANVQARGASRWAGFVPLASQQTDRLMAWPDEGSEIERHLALMEYLGVAADGRDLEFPLDHADNSRADRLAAQMGIDPARMILIHPGARLASRRWPQERFAELGRILAGQGVRLAVTGSAAERPLTAELAAGIGGATVDLGGVTDLGVLAALIQRARLLICNDTGVSHIAAALGSPSVVIACGSDVARWAPLDATLHTVLHADPPCRPCAHEHCPIGHPCALAIGVEQVARAAGLRMRGGRGDER
jgi:ADP-heptose:LPS heptosyltransferase